MCINTDMGFLELHDSMLDFTNIEIFPILLLICLAFLIVYRFIRNDNKYPPGPVGLPFVGYNPFLGEKPQVTLRELSKKFGNIMGIKLGMKYTIVINEYEIFKEAICHPASLNRSPNIFGHLNGLGFVESNGLEWQEQRRYFMQLMRDVGMARGHWNNTLREASCDLINVLLSYNGRPVNISRNLNESTNGNILSLLFGRKFEHDKDGDTIHLFQEYVETALVITGPSKIATLIPSVRKILQYLKIGGYERAAKVSALTSKHIREEMEKRRKVFESTSAFEDDDVITKYLKKMKQVESQKHAGEHFFNDKNLEGNVKAMLLGGSDTVFSSMTWILRLMAKHQDVQERVHTELEEVLGKDGFATYEERQKVPYTFATILESQRVATIVPLSTTRWVSEDFEVRGFTIPKGSEIIGNNWAMHNDPDYWNEPDEFKPERFLSEDGKILKNPASYVVFSLGRRNCPGETVAWTSITVYFTSIIQRFHITPAPGEEVNFDCHEGLVTQLKPQTLCFKERT